MTNPTLEPCPLPNCNGEAVFEHPVTEAVVRCIECGLSLTVSYDASIITSYKKGREFERGAVLAQWNTRPTQQNASYRLQLNTSKQGFVFDKKPVSCAS